MRSRSKTFKPSRQPARPIDLTTAKSAALRMLARRGYTRLELLKRLRRKGASEQTATEAVRLLEQAGLLNDEGVAEDHVRHSRDARSSSRRKIQRELALRGVRPSEAVKVVDAEYPADTELEVALRLVQRRLPQYRDLPLETRMRRIAGLLERRGFSGEIIGTIVRKLKQARDEAD